MMSHLILSKINFLVPAKSFLGGNNLKQSLCTTLQLHIFYLLQKQKTVDVLLLIQLWWKLLSDNLVPTFIKTRKTNKRPLWNCAPTNMRALFTKTCRCNQRRKKQNFPGSNFLRTKTLRTKCAKALLTTSLKSAKECVMNVLRPPLPP